MRVTRPPDAAAFLSAAKAFLAEREALHNLPLAVARNCRSDPARYPGPNYFAIVEDGARICGVAAMTPPYRLQLYVPPGPAVEAVGADLAASPWTPPGVHGPVAAADAFASIWCARRGLRALVRVNFRSFELTRVIPAPTAAGRMRRADAADLAVAQHWWRAFEEEAHVAKGGMAVEEVARTAVREGRVFLWDDDGPVAMAAMVGSTPSGARVGAVYTPAEGRRKGYATALVAAMSQRLLDDGRRFCFLFTDLANPISNSIYPKVGYRPVADLRDIDFVA